MLVAMGLFEAGKGLQCPMHHIMQGACIQPHDLLKQITMLSRHLTLSRAPQCAAPARGGRQRRAGVWLVALGQTRELGPCPGAELHPQPASCAHGKNQALCSLATCWQPSSFAIACVPSSTAANPDKLRPCCCITCCASCCTMLQASDACHCPASPVCAQDVKSSNCLLTASGSAKLEDCGLARLQVRTAAAVPAWHMAIAVCPACYCLLASAAPCKAPPSQGCHPEGACSP